MRRALLLPLLLSTGCFFFTSKGQGEAMRADIEVLRTDLKRQEDTAAQEREKLAQESAARAKVLQDALDQLGRAARKSGADLAVDVEKAQNDIAALRGTLEVIQHRLDSIEKTQVDQQRSLDAITQYVAQRQKDQEKAEHPTDRMGIYNLARARLDAGQIARARELLQDFLTRFPKDELAANAQYWLGESYYAEKRWNDAIGEFQKVIKNHKSSDKVPDALLKIGMSFQAQGDCKNAELFFEEVAQSHHSSTAARLAKEKEAECRKAGKGRKTGKGHK